MSHRKKRSSVGGSDKKHGATVSEDHDRDGDDVQEETEQPQIEQEAAAGDMQEEMGRTIERTTIALGHLLQVVESTAQQVGRLAQEQQNSINFFASWHKYLKAQESGAQPTTGVGNSIVESIQQ